MSRLLLRLRFIFMHHGVPHHPLQTLQSQRFYVSAPASSHSTEIKVCDICSTTIKNIYRTVTV